MGKNFSAWEQEKYCRKFFFVYDFVLGYTSEVLEWEAILVEMSRNSVKSYISVWGFYVRIVS